MQGDQILSAVIIIVVTILSGLADAQGSIHASRIWQNGQLVVGELAQAAGFFAVGIGMYFVAIRFMQQVGIVSPEIQTTIWFGFMIVGVALFNRAFFQWNTLDQIVALVVIGGILWLSIRTGS